MERQQLSDMTVFVEVARAQGFRAASKRLNLKAGSISEAVQRFEDRLGVRLFERSTRSVALTAAGERLYERSLPALADLENAVRDLDDAKQVIGGTLKLSAPYSAGPFFLNKLLADYLDAYPTVNVEVIYDDMKVDLVTSGFEAAIRSNMLLEQDTHALQIGPELNMATVASPDYLVKNGTPQSPDDLFEHNTIGFVFGSSGRLAPWQFSGKDGPYKISPKPRVIVNDLRTMIDFAEQGLGIAYVYAATAKNGLETGRLVPVLDGLVPSLPRYSINYRTKRHMSARLRAFIDLAKQIKSPPIS